MVKKFLAAFFVSALALTLGPIAPASAKEKEITLALWDEVQKPIIQQSIDKFNTKFKGKYKASIAQTPWGEFWTKLDATMPTRSTPDVTWMNVFLPKYANGKVLEPLGPYIKKDKLALSQYVPGRVAAFNYNKEQWALPKGMDAVFVAYNKELFDKYKVSYPRANWDRKSLQAITKLLRTKMDADGATTEYPLAMELDLQPSHANFLAQDGADFVTLDKKQTLAGTPQGIATFQYVVDLMDSRRMAPYTVLSETKASDLFISGKAAIIFVGSWKAKILENSSLGKAKKIGLVQMPKGKIHNYSVAGGLGYAMAKNSQNKAGAWELIKFLTGRQSMTNEALNGIEFPARADAQGAYARGFENIDPQVILAATRTAVPYPHNGNPASLLPLQNAIALAYSGKAPVAETIRAGAAATQRLIDELNK
jgi:multiple sugar transport system substrate-binding protein